MSKTSTKTTEKKTTASKEVIHKNAEIHLIEAKVSYAVVLEPRENKPFKEGDPVETIFRINVHQDDKNKRKLARLVNDFKVRNSLKMAKDGSGDIFMQFKRVAEFMADGKTVANYPKVLDKDGNKWDKKVPIGNGSRCMIFYYLDPFYGNNPGHKIVLSAVQVLDLVPYEPPEKEQVHYIEPDDYSTIQDDDL